MTSISLPDYDIHIGPLADQHFSWLEQRGYAGLAVLTDEHTHRHCWPLLAPWLAGSNRPVVVIEIPAGETHKQLHTCRHVWDQLFAAGAGRRWCLLNLGGGVVGDLGGFCAATYKRGFDFVQIPTTLLSQVDASVGGKLGIDYGGYKNSIGLFADPAAVWIDPVFLDTLPPRELRSGFAEVVKHALIADAGQWAVLQGVTDLASPLNWPELIAHSVGIKRDIVAADPHEQGLRKALNFGHTIGHALESYWLDTPPDPLLHGEAIAAGMVAEAWLSVQQEGLPAEALAAITRYLLALYGHRPVPPHSFDTLIGLMRHDKKNEADEINFSLLSAIGQVKVNCQANATAIAGALTYYNEAGSGVEG